MWVPGFLNLRIGADFDIERLDLKVHREHYSIVVGRVEAGATDLRANEWRFVREERWTVVILVLVLQVEFGFWRKARETDFASYKDPAQ